MTLSDRKIVYNISQKDKDAFWDFVKISRSCGAFDDEDNFSHFREVYAEYESYLNDIDNYSVKTVKNFRILLEEAQEALERRASEVEKSSSEKHLFIVFKNADTWFNKFTEVAAFRRVLDSQIGKETLSPLP